MSAAILVVEHEPRYADRMKVALVGHPIELLFARDGEEALHLVDQRHPQVIVLSSVIPKISTADLIRQIKSRPAGQNAPILITVSGYTGKNPKADAVRLGADDIVPKPFADSMFAEKVQQLLALQAGPKLTSSEIFGDLLSDDRRVPDHPRPVRKPQQNIDELLEQTLSGIRTPGGLRKKTETDAPAAVPKRPTSSGIDRRVQDTLSGLEKSVHAKHPTHKTNPGDFAPPPPPAEEKVMVSAPVLQPIQTIEEQPADESPDRFGQYTLIERIARGGMAEVWKARMQGVEGFEKIVAIKKILPHLSEDTDFVNMFIDEAKLAAQLNHNNIIHIYDLGKIGGSYYIAMEYVEGHDLKDILRRGAGRDLSMPIELALFVGSKVAAALDYAHRKRDFEQKDLGIVHRDVSPQNVLISTEGDIKLCDFGIAKAESKVSHTKAGALKGKLQYMSPEQAWGKSIDRRSDLFALGSVLFEMLSGHRLFSGDNEISVLEQVREASVQPPSRFNEDVPPQVDQVVLRALQREPEGRYQTAGEMAREIDSILYTFRPTPTSADLAIYLDRLYAAQEEPLLSAPQPVVEAPAAPPPAPAPNPVVHTPSHAPAGVRSYAPVHAAVSEPRILGGVVPRRRNLTIPIAAGLLIAVAAAGTVFVLVRKETAAATPVQAASVARSQVPGAQPVPETTSAIVPSVTESARELVPAPGPETVDEQAIINEEVRRRLAAERARLDQQRAQQIAAQQQAAERASAPPRTEPRELVAPPTQTLPLQTNTAQVAPEQPVPGDDTGSAASQVPTTATQEASPPPAQVREGDLVAPGTPGLVEPVLVSMKKVQYPPIAKMHKVGGNVIVSALVSETGRVIEAKILRGVPQNVGINEAALEMVRGATFQPATKDGTRVKANKTLVVPFKL